MGFRIGVGLALTAAVLAVRGPAYAADVAAQRTELKKM